MAEAFKFRAILCFTRLAQNKSESQLNRTTFFDSWALLIFDDLCLFDTEQAGSETAPTNFFVPTDSTYLETVKPMGGGSVVASNIRDLQFEASQI